MRSERCELASTGALEITCEDCGRVRRFHRWKIVEFERRGLRTFQELGSRLYCRVCNEQHGRGGNISLRPLWFAAPHLRSR